MLWVEVLVLDFGEQELSRTSLVPIRANNADRKTQLQHKIFRGCCHMVLAAIHYYHMCLAPVLIFLIQLHGKHPQEHTESLSIAI